MTGDYRLTTNKKAQLKDAHIVVVTSEMLDSQTRSAVRNKDHWLHNIGLVIMDEANIIGSPQRGPAAEAGLTRLCVSKEVAPRIVLLSATLPNEEDFAHWLFNLNHKKTYTLNSKWRPVPLKWNFYPNSQKYYKAIRNEMAAMACKIVQKYKDDKFLIFVHEKATGHNVVAAMKKIGIQAEFHRADAVMKKRIEIEKNFLDKKSSLRVLVSTSTLAYGNNLPARHVIIMGTNRGISPVDIADIIQMSGRSGRYMIDTQGDCHLLCQDQQTSKWAKIVQKSPVVKSSLLDKSHLRFQILAEIDLGLIKNISDLPNWFNRTLASKQLDYVEEYFRDTLSKLIDMDMIQLENDELKVTPLGRIGVQLYFTPDDIYYWYKFIQKQAPIDSDCKIATLLGGTPTIRLNYVPKEFKGSVSRFIGACRREKMTSTPTEPFTSYALWEHLQGNAKDQAGLNFYIQNIVHDMDRIGSALQRIAELTKSNIPEDIILRIRHGVPKQLAFLCNIPNIGPKKAWLLYTAGVTDPDKLSQVDRGTLITCLGVKTADKVIEYLQG